MAGYFLHSVVKYMYVHFFFYWNTYTSLLYQQLTFGRVRLIFFICMQQERFCTLFQSMAIRCLYIKLHMQSMALIFISTFVKSSTLAIFSRERSEELALADNDPAYVGFGCNFGSAFSGDKNWWVWWKFGVLLADNIRLLLMEESFSSPVIKQFANFIIKPYKFFILFWLANFLCLSKVVPVYVLQKKNRNLNRCLFFTLSIIPRFPMDFGKDPFFPISANDLMVGSSLPPPFSVIFFWFWCLWRINRTSRTFSFMDSSNCLATTALSITSSVRQGRQLFQYYVQQ